MAAGIEDIKAMMKNERIMLEMLSRMKPEDYAQLMAGQDKYSQAVKESSEKERRQAELETRKLEKEIQELVQKEETRRAELLTEERKRQAEINRKHKMELVEREAEEQKKRIDYALKQETEVQKERTNLKLEAKRQFDQLDLERKMKEEEIEEGKAKIRKREREEEYERMAELEKIKIEAKALADKAAEIDLAEHRFDQKLKMFNATKEEELRRSKELLKIENEANLEIKKLQWDAFSDYFSGEEGRSRTYNLGGLLTLTTALGCSMWIFSPLARTFLFKYFLSPRLVNRQEVFSKRGKAKETVEVILPEKLQERMNRILVSTRNTRENKGLYGNLMLYGKPGTGKTLWAEKLAREARMDFAVMSGPSFDQFEKGEAITEIKKLFNWVDARKNGVLLFIDEADTFLEDRATLHPHRVSVLNEWINQTGTESRKFMCVYETNRPEVMDPAVLSRVSTTVEMEPPTVVEIEKLLRLYVDKYVTSSRKISYFRTMEGLKSPYLAEDDNLKKIAETFAQNGFVGRDVSNFAINLFKAGTGSEIEGVSEEMVQEVIEEQITKKQTEQRYLELREERLKDHRNQLLSFVK